MVNKKIGHNKARKYDSPCETGLPRVLCYTYLAINVNQKNARTGSGNAESSDVAKKDKRSQRLRGRCTTRLITCRAYFFSCQPESLNIVSHIAKFAAHTQVMTRAVTFDRRTKTDDTGKKTRFVSTGNTTYTKYWYHSVTQSIGIIPSHRVLVPFRLRGCESHVGNAT